MVAPVTAWAVVVDAAVARMVARSGYRSCWDTTRTGIPVFDCGEAGDTGDSPNASLVIGWPGEDGEVEPGDAGAVRADVGKGRRDEDGVVRCLASAWSGDDGRGVMSATRARALAIVADVNAELQATSRALGITSAGSGLQSVEVWIGGLPSVRTSVGSGAQVDVMFDLQFTARL